MLISECCSGTPYFALGETHGVNLTVDNEFWGYCGVCKDPAKFNVTPEKEDDYSPTDDGSWEGR